MNNKLQSAEIFLKTLIFIPRTKIYVNQTSTFDDNRRCRRDDNLLTMQNSEEEKKISRISSVAVDQSIETGKKLTTNTSRLFVIFEVMNWS